ncbi:MAG: NUDIX hydrolase [Candidatus Eremiobacteraeota bacterium]|nr:NUDIX hydrolase [Candidatus Eremiobacteraeota bacterium]
MKVAEARVHLVAGILEREGAVLLAASRYANHPQALWNLPGGRQRHGELLDEALRREFLEETGLHVAVGELAYVSESYDRDTDTHFIAVVFGVDAEGDAALDRSDPHVVELAWVPRDELGTRIHVPVVREPLLAHLADRRRRYFCRADAGITIEFLDSP